MARKGENIFHRKDGRWEARYIKGQDNFGKKTYGYVYGKTYQEVKNKRNEILLNLDYNSHKSNRILPKKDFNNNIDEWLHREELFLKKSTYSHYTNVINKHIRPFFGNYSIERINESLINEYIRQKININKLKISTINQIIVILNSILRFFNYNLNIKIPRQKKEPLKLLKETEILRLQNYITSNVDGYTTGILISLHTGLRIGEICALRWMDIDLENETLIVKHTVSRILNKESSQVKTRLVLDTAKTDNSVRIIPINSILLMQLMRYKKNNTKETDFIISNSPRIADPRTFYNNYKKILKKCGLKEYTYHTLRHTFATKCCRLGLDPKSLSEILGHSNVKTTLAIYVHPDMETKKKFLNTTFINY